MFRRVTGLIGALLVALALLAGFVALPIAGANLTGETENPTNAFTADEWVEVIALDAGTAHACLARDLGGMWCWGRNDKGQLGDNTTTDHWIPKAVSGPGGSGVLTDVVDVATGSEHSCAATSGGSAYCWGKNDKGQLGDNTTTNRSTPVQVRGAGGTGFLTDVVTIAAGLTHSCAVTSAGSAYCWGVNGNGQLGDNTTTNRSAPVQVRGVGGTGFLTDVVDVATGSEHSCIVTGSGSTYCWGRNDTGQLGDNTTTTTRTAPVQVRGVGGTGFLTGTEHIAGGLRSSCAATASGSAYCWGRNDKGQLGDNTTTDRPAPVQVRGVGGTGFLTGAIDIASGLSHSCAATGTGSAYCWGVNGKGQLGDDTTTDRSAPVQVTGSGGVGTLANAVLVAGGDEFSCAATSDWTVYCWGRNNNGQLGDNATTDRSAPVQVKGGGWTGIFDAVQIAAGGAHSCGLRIDGSVWCWGDNLNGQLGDDTTTDSAVPIRVKGAGGIGFLTDVTAIATGSNHSCAVKSDGTAWCWGSNFRGKLGDNTLSARHTPVQVKGPGGSGFLTDVTTIAGESGHSCAVKSDGTAWCWGDNLGGKLGDNTTTDRFAPVQVKGPGGSGFLTGVNSITTGDLHTCAVKSDGTAWCWGDNAKGQVGDNTTTDRLTPVQVKGAGGSGFLTGVVRIAAGVQHSCASTSSAAAWCWGENGKGQLGDNTTTDRIAPVQVRGLGGSGFLGGVADVTTGLEHSCAVASSATMSCWGKNDKGRLGDGTTTDRSAPVAVVGSVGSDVAAGAWTVSAGDEHTCAIASDQAAWCWGKNASAQLGDGTTTDSSTPSQVI